MLRGEPLPIGRFVPQRWPSTLRSLLKVVSGWLKRQWEKARRKQRKRQQRRRQKNLPVKKPGAG